MDIGNINETQALFRLDGKVAIITGAAGLLGEQHALALSDYGARVVLTDLKPEIVEARAAEITKRTTLPALGLSCDVTSKGSWESLLEKVMQEFGQVDVLINNAGFTNQSRSANFSAPYPDFPLEDWNQILEVNLTGTFLGCQVIGKQMLAQAQGSIINMASLYGVVSPNHKMYPGTGISQPVAYSVSKAGVLALTRYLAGLWGETGVRVNCITPGGVYNNHKELFVERFSNLNPMGRMEKKEELRGAVVYLASQASSYCNGHNLVVDGGWTIW
jgi:NAD(P)-dependent dehydrogenase (short-subunit alcohol dehydrogenase family)